jgi:peptidyl-prolyl cis-trans isomerase A (cyclophilin A)
MIRRLALIALLLATAGQAQTPSSAPPPASTPDATPPAAAPQPVAPAPVPATVRVVLTTSYGPIVLALEKERAPVTTAYFLKYVDQKRLDGVAFYRAYDALKDGSVGLIQGGVQSDPKRLLPPVAHEPTSKTGLSHTDGAISLARLAPGTATANFFIIVGQGMQTLDAQPQGKGDPDGYAVFGHVVEGMDVVKKILTSPVSPTLGEGAMKGQMLAEPVKILTARRQ